MAIVEALELGEEPRRLRVTSPVDGSEIGVLDCATADEVEAAVERAREAQKKWGALSIDERQEHLWRLLDQFVERQDEIIDAVMRETGKPRAEAIAMEVYAPCDAIGFYTKRAKKFLAPEKRRVHGVLGLAKKLRIVYKPLGVVGLITPWNGPVALAAVPTVQALLAGNTVVHKPSEVTPFSALVLQQFIRDAGFPDDVYQVVLGDGATGAALVDSGVDKVSFTGSVATGRKVAEACGRRLIPCTMELGGKDAMIVCADADLDRAAEGAVFGSCMNSGHFCCGTERIYVHQDVYEPFLAKVQERVAALRQSDHGEFDVGAIFWDRQMDIIERHMEDARTKGAKVVLGGSRNPELKGLYFQPTLVTDVDHNMELMRSETFGPILSVMKVKDDEEAIRLANDSDYGLNGNVWTLDTEKGFKIAERLETGGACINDMAITYGVCEAPFGGVKDSGVGSVNSITGIRGYCHAMPITADRRGKGKIQGGFPYDRATEDGMQKFIKILWGTRIGRWFS